jgi:hypothetical protein
MYKTNPKGPELAGRNPAGENTALFALEGLIRKQLEASAQGVLPLNETGKRLCSMPQEHEIDLLAVTRGHKAK